MYKTFLALAFALLLLACSPEEISPQEAANQPSEIIQPLNTPAPTIAPTATTLVIDLSSIPLPPGFSQDQLFIMDIGTGLIGLADEAGNLVAQYHLSDDGGLPAWMDENGQPFLGLAPESYEAVTKIISIFETMEMRPRLVRGPDSGASPILLSVTLPSENEYVFGGLNRDGILTIFDRDGKVILEGVAALAATDMGWMALSSTGGDAAGLGLLSFTDYNWFFSPAVEGIVTHEGQRYQWANGQLDRFIGENDVEFVPGFYTEISPNVQMAGDKFRINFSAEVLRQRGIESISAESSLIDGVYERIMSYTYSKLGLSRDGEVRMTGLKRSQPISPASNGQILQGVIEEVDMLVVWREEFDWMMKALDESGVEHIDFDYSGGIPNTLVWFGDGGELQVVYKAYMGESENLTGDEYDASWAIGNAVTMYAVMLEQSVLVGEAKIKIGYSSSWSYVYSYFGCVLEGNYFKCRSDGSNGLLIVRH